MKTTWGYRIWQIVYPIGIYYVVSSLIYFALELLIGTAVETYMLRQLVCAACTIPVTLRFYQQDAVIRNTVYGKKQLKLDGAQIKNILCTLIAAAALGIAVNNIIAMTPLISASAGFQTANEFFFGGTVVYELLGSCLMVPIAEELLFRGVVYQRLKGMMGTVPQADRLIRTYFWCSSFQSRTVPLCHGVGMPVSVSLRKDRIFLYSGTRAYRGKYHSGMACGDRSIVFCLRTERKGDRIYHRDASYCSRSDLDLS